MTQQSALADLTYLGHMTHFNKLDNLDVRLTVSDIKWYIQC